MSGETEDQPSAWTIDSLFQHVRAIFAEHDLRYEQRFQSQEANLSTAMIAQEKAVQAALASSEKAVSKAEVAAEKRFDAVNEFRGQLADQARDFMPRKEAELLVTALADKIEALTGTRSQGVTAAVGYVVGAIGALVGVVSLILAFNR